MPDFRTRSYELELMDHPIEDAAAIEQNFDDLQVINRWLGGAGLSIQGLRKLAQERPIDSVVDVGSGGGDLVAAIEASRIANQVLALDSMAEAHAFMRARHPQLQNVESIHSSYQNWFAQGGSADVVHAALFCHHLTDQELVEFLRGAHKAASMGVVINDLHRHPLAYHSIKWLTKGFAKSYFTKNDAPLSVLRGFVRDELEHILHQAGITNYSLEWRWAFRYLLIIPS